LGRVTAGDGLDPAAFAELLVGYCLDVAAGEQVLVRSTTLAAPLLLELQRAVLARGAWPLLRTELPGQAEAFYGHAGDAQLDQSAPLALTEVREAACVLGIQAPENTRALSDIDPTGCDAPASPASRCRRPCCAPAGARRCGRRTPARSRPA
jgi:leucyl aminopeptidase (aminopeptidase T)